MRRLIRNPLKTRVDTAASWPARCRSGRGALHVRRPFKRGGMRGVPHETVAFAERIAVPSMRRVCRSSVQIRFPSSPRTRREMPPRPHLEGVARGSLPPAEESECASATCWACSRSPSCRPPLPRRVNAPRCRPGPRCACSPLWPPRTRFPGRSAVRHRDAGSALRDRGRGRSPARG